MPRSASTREQQAQARAQARRTRSVKGSPASAAASSGDEAASSDAASSADSDSGSGEEDDDRSSDSDASEADESADEDASGSSDDDDDEEEEEPQPKRRKTQAKPTSRPAASSSKAAAAPAATKSAPKKTSAAPAPAPAAKSTRKRPHSDADEDMEEEPEAAASSSSNSVTKKSRGGRIVRKPAAADDTPSEAEDDDESGPASSSSSSAAKKRVRGSTPAPLLDPDELSDEWRCSANEVLSFRLVRPSPEKDTHISAQVETLNFHPTFTHQLWDEEEIVGYKKVKALVAFTSGALYTYLNVEYESKCQNADVSDIQTLIGSKLRGGFTEDWEDFKKHIHDPFRPPGELLCEYTLPSVDNYSLKERISYEVYRGSFASPQLKEYHARLQFFLLFFIDRSSFINDADPVWEVLLLFQKRVCTTKQVTTYHIVGYTTLYKFLAYPTDWKMRLSQILILPPYQRAGHGQKLLDIVYKEAEKRGMIEVNIEDPSPGFQTLRDLTDIQLCKKHRFFEKTAGSASEFDPLEKWDPAYAKKIKDTLRITLAQVRRCYEIFKLNAVGDRHKTSKSEHTHGRWQMSAFRCIAMTAYRLEVKARLFHAEQEVLSMYSHKPAERKEKLAEMYNELEHHYMLVIKRARLH